MYEVYDCLIGEVIKTYKRKGNAERRRRSEITLRNLLESAIIIREKE